MLTYLILTTRTMIMAAAVCGSICGYISLSESKKTRRATWTICLIGIIASFVIAFFENRTNIVDTAILNGCLYIVAIVSFILYIIFSIKKISRGKTALEYINNILLGLSFASIFAYAAPTVWGYPYQVYLSERTVISTEFLLDIIGMLFGLVLCLIVFLSARKCILTLKPFEASVLLKILLLINVLVRIAGLFAVLLQKRIVVSNHLLFTYSVFVKNRTDQITFITLIILVLVYAVLYIRGVTQKEPYNNPAEQRKILAKWRRVYRWAYAMFFAAVMGILTLTLFVKLNTPDTSLSPIEEVSDQDDVNMYIDYDLLQDEHIHRFAYTTDKNVDIRFIIIKKPNANAYGIGLDACDICGETGYYEKDGQVVCNLCDQVININSIGFKGGCNPIVIPYELSSGRIIIPIEGLLEYEAKFK